MRIKKKINPNSPYFIPARGGRIGGRRACLCVDTNDYSIECCDGSLWAQGIGSISRTN